MVGNVNTSANNNQQKDVGHKGFSLTYFIRTSFYLWFALTDSKNLRALLYEKISKLVTISNLITKNIYTLKYLFKMSIF